MTMLNYSPFTGSYYHFGGDICISMGKFLYASCSIYSQIFDDLVIAFYELCFVSVAVI